MYLGNLGFYVSWIDANLRDHDHHLPTVGILVCAGRNNSVVRYSLAAATQPLGRGRPHLRHLPAAIQELLPSEAQFAGATHIALQTSLNHTTDENP